MNLSHKLHSLRALHYFQLPYNKTLIFKATQKFKKKKQLEIQFRENNSSSTRTNPKSLEMSQTNINKQ